MTRKETDIITKMIKEKAASARGLAEKITYCSIEDMRYDTIHFDIRNFLTCKTEMYAFLELAHKLGMSIHVDDDFSVYMEEKPYDLDDYHIKMETENGMTRWLETETTDGDKTIIFETFYDAEGVCRSEEIVGWIWGEDVTEEDIKDFADKKNLKATYEL